MPTTADAVRLRSYWKKVPDRRAGTYYRRTAVGPPATYATGVALNDLWHRKFSNKPHPGNPGVYVIYEADLYFPKETNSTYATTTPPLPGDQIQDGSAATVPYTGRLWTVVDVEEAGGQGTWHIHSVAPAIISAVGIAIQIQTPTVTLTNAGLRNITAWTTITGGSQTAWIQGTTTAADDLLGKRQIPDNGILYLPTSVSVDAQMTVLETVSGARYTITKVSEQKDFIDLMEITVEILH